ncbi:MAG: TolC family protein [Thermoanaerobaculia bacterium]|nr:TolC family protein [Thermoanaerobaculia bacterium]
MKSTIKLLAAIVLIAASQNPIAARQQPEPDERLERTALIETILERNPTIDAARRAVEAMEARVTAAGSLEDPRLSTSIAPLTLDDSSIGSSIEVSQEIPWPGRLRAREDLARAGVAMQNARLDQVRIDLSLRGSMLYDRWYLVHRALELNAHHRDLVEQMKASAESQYVVGAAAQQDPLQAEVRATKLLTERSGLEAERRIIQAGMNALMHLPPEARIPPPVESLATPAVVLTEEIRTDQPDLLLARAAIEEAEAELRLAELEKRPDLMAMGQFTSMFQNEDHRFMTGVSFRLPVRRSRIEAEIRAARADLEESREKLSATETEVRFEFQEALYELDSLLETVRLYENLLIPASRDQTEAAQAGFTTGRNSFLAVLDAENNLEEVLLGYHRTLSRAWSAAAKAQAVLGEVPFYATELNDE